MLLCLLLAMRGVRFFIEQPAQSYLDEQPRFEEMLRLIQVARRFCECLFVFAFNFLRWRVVASFVWRVPGICYQMVDGEVRITVCEAPPWLVQ